MKISLGSNLSIGGVMMRALSVPAIRSALGPCDIEEKIPLFGGGMRIRERWTRVGISVLRDCEDEALALTIDSPLIEVDFLGVRLPEPERDFVRTFPIAEKDYGHHFLLRSDDWRMDVYFELGPKRRGVGSTIRRLARVIVAKKEKPNQSPEPTRTCAQSVRKLSPPSNATGRVAHL